MRSAMRLGLTRLLLGPKTCVWCALEKDKTSAKPLGRLRPTVRFYAAYLEDLALAFLTSFLRCGDWPSCAPSQSGCGRRQLQWEAATKADNKNTEKHRKTQRRGQARRGAN